jgi:hypothetical protein
VTTSVSNKFTFGDYEQAQEYYLDNGLTDGLPIVPPTEAKVRAMLDGSGLQPSDVVSVEGVRGKTFLAGTVAVNAVMAGCKPEYMPVVVAAVQAVSEPEFNFHANSTSTNGVGVLVLVSGPIAKKIGINSGSVAMGHGYRANATIGRTLGLLKINAYGSIPHDMDKSTLGHAGKYTFCFAEDDDAIPWEPLRVEKGFSADTSTVTVFAANSPLQVSTHSHSQPPEILEIVSDAIRGMGLGSSEVIVVISPEVLEYVRNSGWSKTQIKEFIFKNIHRTGGEWNSHYRTEAPYSGDDLNKGFPVVDSPDHLTIVGAGGEAGAFVAMIGAWGGVSSVTKEISTGR